MTKPTGGRGGDADREEARREAKLSQMMARKKAANGRRGAVRAVLLGDSLPEMTGGRLQGTARVVAQIKAAGVTPLDLILAAAYGDTQITDRQLGAAIAAAPYVHPRLTAVQATVSREPGRPTDIAAVRALSDEQIASVRRMLADARPKAPIIDVDTD